jgi:hypothetical protein
MTVLVLMRRKTNIVTIDADVPENANGVLYKLGSNSGAPTPFAVDGILCYEYNRFIIQRTLIRGNAKLRPGKTRIEVETKYYVARPAVTRRTVKRRPFKFNREDRSDEGEIPANVTTK